MSILDKAHVWAVDKEVDGLIRDDDEYDGVWRDHLAGAHGTSGPGYPAAVDEQTKVQLAKRISHATSPGAVMEYLSDHNSPKPSQDQLEEMGNMRMMHKNRRMHHHGEEHAPEPPKADEEQPLDDFQERMNEIRSEEDMLEHKELKKRRRRTAKWCLLAIVGTAVVVTVGLGSSSSQKVEETANIEANAFHDCYMLNGTNPSERFSRLRNAVTPPWQWGPSSIDSARSSQRAALCWLSELDSWKWESANGAEYEVVQRFALASVYFHFVGLSPEIEGPGFAGSNWLDGVHVCDWDFVSCEGPSNRITDLVLAGMRLDKPIPEEVALLSDLIYLKLTRCQLTGRIPSSISVLSQLEVLVLTRNELTGTIPSELGGLSDLEFLDLSVNQITGTIPSSIWFFPRLATIRLHSTFVSGTIPAAIGQLTPLHVLQLGGTNVHGSIPSTIGNLSLLRILDLDSVASLSGTIPTELARLSRLDFLWLPVFSNLSGDIPDEICNLPHPPETDKPSSTTLDCED